MQDSPKQPYRVEDYTILDRPYDELPYLYDLLYRGGHYYFEGQMRIARRSVFAGEHRVEVFAGPPNKRLLLYAPVP